MAPRPPALTHPTPARQLPRTQGPSAPTSLPGGSAAHRLQTGEGEGAARSPAHARCGGGNPVAEGEISARLGRGSAGSPPGRPGAAGLAPLSPNGIVPPVFRGRQKEGREPPPPPNPSQSHAELSPPVTLRAVGCAELPRHQRGRNETVPPRRAGKSRREGPARAETPPPTLPSAIPPSGLRGERQPSGKPASYLPSANR